MVEMSNEFTRMFFMYAFICFCLRCQITKTKPAWSAYDNLAELELCIQQIAKSKLNKLDIEWRIIDAQQLPFDDVRH